MLILEHNVLEVILRAFMDQLQPFLNGKFGLDIIIVSAPINFVPRVHVDDAMYQNKLNTL